MQSLRIGLVSERHSKALVGLSGGGLPRRLKAFLLAAAAAAASAAAAGLIIPGTELPPAAVAGAGETGDDTVVGRSSISSLQS